MAPEFIAHARNSAPNVTSTLRSLNSLNAGTGSIAEVHSWYSLIHYQPETMRVPLKEFSHVLKPRGTLLVGFFEGPVVEELAHAVTPAYRWLADRFGAELNATGFDVAESHVRKVTGQRPLAAIVADAESPAGGSTSERR
ncbi:MAG TPA: hypothetical protein VGN33_05175 [Leifsonia sp.]|nr:hypothetical protein [Leifsonia sp.]